MSGGRERSAAQTCAPAEPLGARKREHRVSVFAGGGATWRGTGEISDWTRIVVISRATAEAT